MEFRPVFYAFLILCAITFFEVLLTIRKKSLLKICFLLIIASLFVMNYFSYLSVSTRLQFILVKSMRLVYVASTLLIFIHLVTPRIPRWIIGFMLLSSFFLIGVRVANFNEIAIDSQAPFSSQVFSVGPEFYSPIPAARYIAFTMAAAVSAVTFYYYRLFFLKMNKENIYYTHLSRWIMAMITPFFLLIIFAALGILHFIDESIAPYLFSFFSGIIIFSILLRPKFLNSTWQLNDQEESVADESLVHK